MSAACAASANALNVPVSVIRRPGSRLLVVDDEHSITAALRDYFAILGYVVDVAESERTAHAMLAECNYAAVITDLSLSDNRRLEGLDVIRHVRVRHPGAACIVLTAYDDAEYESEARQCGADALLQKPAPLTVLAGRLAHLLDQYHQNL